MRWAVRGNGAHASGAYESGHISDMGVTEDAASRRPARPGGTRFLEQVNGLPPSDPWFTRLRDAYLEPWGSGLTDTFPPRCA